MHINFEDDGIIVQNIQTFLKDNYDKQLILSGVYDTATHKALINYLKQPNTWDVLDVKSAIIDKFTYRQIKPPHSLIDGGGIFNFNNKVTPNSIYFYSKPNHKYFDAAVTFICDHSKELSEFVKTMGWTLKTATYDNLNTLKDKGNIAEIYIEKTGIINYFPNEAVLPMINLFEGNYIYKRCFTGMNRFDNHTQDNDNFKLAVVECEPGDVFTIAHGFSTSCEMAIGYTDKTPYELKYETHTIDGVINRTYNSPQGPVGPGSYEIYTVPKNSYAKYIVIQLPFKESTINSSTVTKSVKLGDINQDGVIDTNDLSLLRSWVEAKEKNQKPPFTLEGNALAAANLSKNIDLDGNPIVDRDDLNILTSAIENGTTSELGSYNYQLPVTYSKFELDRLLVMKGDNVLDEDLNVPVKQFWIEPWAVHSKFIEYFLGRVIHKYSDIEDIVWLQRNIQVAYPEYGNKFIGKFDEPRDWLTGDELILDNTSSKVKWYRGNLYTGCYADSAFDLFNTYFRKEDKSYCNIFTKDGKIYVDGEYDGRVILSNWKIAYEGAEYSLRSCLRKFQVNHNNLSSDGVGSQDEIYWANGDYDVSTDYILMKELSDKSIPNTTAFR